MKCPLCCHMSEESALYVAIPVNKTPLSTLYVSIKMNKIALSPHLCCHMSEEISDDVREGFVRYELIFYMTLE